MINKQTIFTAVAGLAMVLGLMFMTAPIHASIKAGDITGGEKAPHVNIAIFHKVHGKETFKYPEYIDAKDILGNLAGMAQFISLNHTAGLKDGDVITIGNDVLRDAGGAGFEDFGVDCQMGVRIKAENVTVAGVCQILMVDKDHREIAHKGVIKPTTLHPDKGWTLVHYSHEDGIAVYVNEEIGLE